VVGPAFHGSADYVVLGAGSAGCVLANRFRANGKHCVFLSGAGGPDRNPMIHAPKDVRWVVGNSTTNWCYRTLSQRGASARVAGRARTRLAACKVELHPQQTMIVYCKNYKRPASYPGQRFKSLRYTFWSSASEGGTRQMFIAFVPAVSGEAAKAMPHDAPLAPASPQGLDVGGSGGLGPANHYRLDELLRSLQCTALAPTFRPLDAFLLWWARRK